MNKYIENFLYSLFKKVVIELDLENKIKFIICEQIDKLRYDYLPHGACWMCSMPISRGIGYIMWTGKLFCGEECVKKYQQLICLPNENHKYLTDSKGVPQPIEVFYSSNKDK